MLKLQQILFSQGFGTRRQCDALIASGSVLVDGVAQRDGNAELATGGLVLTDNDEPWPFHERAYVMLHKPAGYECSRKTRHHPSVLELLPAPLRERGVQPVGRLDEDTTGLLLLTDDGQLNHQLSSGKRKVPKVYLATTKHPLDAEQISRLLSGVVLNDESAPVAAAAAEIAGERLLRLTMTEGKYHQVKRMVAAAGNRVEALHREAVGGLSLPAGLKPGEWRWLAAVDLEKLGDFA